MKAIPMLFSLEIQIRAASRLPNESIHFAECFMLQTVNVCQKTYSQFEQTTF